MRLAEHRVEFGVEPDLPHLLRAVRLRTAWTAAELMAADFPPPRWTVPGLIAEGVNLLAGPPKVGKSRLSLGLALAVTAGSPVLGSIEVEAGPPRSGDGSTATWPPARPHPKTSSKPSRAPTA